jgi:hypothetical protein
MIEREFENRTSLIVDPPDGKIPPYTPEGRERNAQSPPVAGGGPRPPAGPEDLSNSLRCLTYGTPRVGQSNVASAGPLAYSQIVQAPGYVVLVMEGIHEARIISLDGRPHLPQQIKQLSGDSRGRWEGDTLVVDTTNFSRLSNFMGATENLHVTERFTRTGPERLDYQVTIADPTTWTRPWTVLIHLKRTTERLYEYACHEGNFDVMRGMLVGARMAERAGQGLNPR